MSIEPNISEINKMTITKNDILDLLEEESRESFNTQIKELRQKYTELHKLKENQTKIITDIIKKEANKTINTLYDNQIISTKKLVIKVENNSKGYYYSCVNEYNDYYDKISIRMPYKSSLIIKELKNLEKIKEEINNNDNLRCDLNFKLNNLKNIRRSISAAITKKALKENKEGNLLLNYINTVKGNVSQLLISKK